jgi:hypothetical protein
MTRSRISVSVVELAGHLYPTGICIICLEGLDIDGAMGSNGFESEFKPPVIPQAILSECTSPPSIPPLTSLNDNLTLIIHYLVAPLSETIAVLIQRHLSSHSLLVYKSKCRQRNKQLQD